MLLLLTLLCTLYCKLAFLCLIINTVSYKAESDHMPMHPTAVPSASPRVYSAVALSSTLISLHWLPPPSIHINGRIQYYIANITETKTGKKWIFNAVEKVLRIGSLHPDYAYEFTVTARTIGNGPYSLPATVRTREDGMFMCSMYTRITNNFQVKC